MDASILSISHVEVSAAKVLAKGPAVLVVSSMVQQINCITNAKASGAAVCCDPDARMVPPPELTCLVLVAV